MNRRIVVLTFNQSGEAAGAPPEIVLGEELLVNCALPLKLDAAAILRLEGWEMKSRRRLFGSRSWEAGRVNCAGDWGEERAGDPAAGEVTFRVATATAGFARALRSAEAPELILWVALYRDGGHLPTILGRVEFQGVDRGEVELDALPEDADAHPDADTLGALLLPEPYFEDHSLRDDDWRRWGVFHEEALALRLCRDGAAVTPQIRLPIAPGPRVDLRIPWEQHESGDAAAARPNWDLHDPATGNYYIKRANVWSPPIPIGGAEIAVPVCAPPLVPARVDAGGNRLTRLDAAEPAAMLWGRRNGLESLTMVLRAAADSNAGDCAVIFTADGEVCHRAILAAGSEFAGRRVDFAAPVSGEIRLWRDCGAADDTAGTVEIRSVAAGGALADFRAAAALDPACRLALLPDDGAADLAPAPETMPFRAGIGDYAAAPQSWHEATRQLRLLGCDDFEFAADFDLPADAAPGWIFGAAGFGAALIAGGELELTNALTSAPGSGNSGRAAIAPGRHTCRIGRSGGLLYCRLDEVALREQGGVFNLDAGDFAGLLQTTVVCGLRGIRLRNLANGRVVWHGPALGGYYGLIRQSNIRSDRGVFECSQGGQWRLDTLCSLRGWTDATVRLRFTVSAAGAAVLFCQGEPFSDSPEGNVIGLYLNAGSELELFTVFHCGDAGNVMLRTSSAVLNPVVGVACDVAAVVDFARGAVEIYFNGILAGASVMPEGARVLGDGWALETGGVGIEGDERIGVEEVWVYGRALGAEELKALTQN